MAFLSVYKNENEREEGEIAVVSLCVAGCSPTLSPCTSPVCADIHVMALITSSPSASICQTNDQPALANSILALMTPLYRVII